MLCLGENLELMLNSVGALFAAFVTVFEFGRPSIGCLCLVNLPLRWIVVCCVGESTLVSFQAPAQAGDSCSTRCWDIGPRR